MKGALLIALLILNCQLPALETLPDAYLVKYGSAQAPFCITQYFSFTCPHCIALFRKQFQQIKEKYIEAEKISWIFHPVPMDLLTVQAMECLSKLSNDEKVIFLEAILEELYFDEPQLSAQLMMRGMEILGKPITRLQEKPYLSETSTFQDAFQFLKQDHAIEAVPSIDINGQFLSAQIPDIDFIEDLLFTKRQR